MNPKGMLGIIAAVRELPCGSCFRMRSVTTPMASATPTAPARERSRAATTAANAAAIRVVIPVVVNPLVGATRIPARPASVALTTHAPRATRPGFVPDTDAIASESTVARTRRPMLVKRRS